MAKHSFRAFLGCLLAIVAINCTKAQAATNKVYNSDLIDCDSIAVGVELYIWNRISDLLDICQFGIAAGPGLGFEVAVTDFLQLGMYANCEQGIIFPHVFPPFWLVDYYENNEWFTIHSGKYATASFGPWRAESSTRTSAYTTPKYFTRYDAKFNPDYRWDIRVQADAVLLHAYFNFRTLELADFFCGIVGYDLTDDDCHEDPTIVRRPANQFGRGLSNILFGVFEVPLNIIRVNEVEGDLPAITKGVGLGVWRFLVREIVGVTEVITFPFGWQPIIEPEYVFEIGRNNSDYGWRVYRPSFHKRY